MSEQGLRWTGEGFGFEGRDQQGHVFGIDTDPQGVGAKPSDLVPISLAACTSWDVVNILRKQRQALEGLEVKITSEQEPEAPWAFTGIHLHFIITGDVDPAKAERAIELSESRYCSVAATLRPNVELSHSLEIVAG